MKSRKKKKDRKKAVKHGQRINFEILSSARNIAISRGLDAAATFLKSRVPGPLMPDYLTNLAINLQHSKPGLSLESARQAVTLAPEKSSGAALLCGQILNRQGRLQEAAEYMLHVVQTSASTPEQILVAATTLARHSHGDTACQAAVSAFDKLGGPLRCASALLYISLVTANWERVEELTSQLREGYSQNRHQECNELLRTHLLWCDDLSCNIAAVQNWSLKNIPAIPSAHPPVVEPLEGRRLRIGYLSSDFRDHPTSRLIQGLLAAHDRNRVELFMYCTGWDDGSELRRSIESHFEHKRSLSGMDDKAAAELIRSDHIDALIELNGPTRFNRMGILAYRPAPVQVSYLGFPGSVGGRVVDYIVADYHTVPEGEEKYYPERIIRLNGSYQPNAFRFFKRPEVPSRAGLGLPEGDALIVGMFNMINKVRPEVWSAWMSILKLVPKAFLWTLDPGAAARGNLLKATQEQGVSEKRILFAPHLPQPQHLARLGACDLMLDPWPYGGHTSTTDALFAGVPVITLEGRNFAGRVSGSLLKIAKVPVLVRSSVQDYIQTASGLLNTPEELKRLQNFIREKVPKSPLFANQGQVRDLETALEAAVKMRQEGKKLMNINIRQPSSGKQADSESIDWSNLSIAVVTPYWRTPWEKLKRNIRDRLSLQMLRR